MATSRAKFIYLKVCSVKYFSGCSDKDNCIVTFETPYFITAAVRALVDPKAIDISG